MMRREGIRKTRSKEAILSGDPSSFLPSVSAFFFFVLALRVPPLFPPLVGKDREVAPLKAFFVRTALEPELRSALPPAGFTRSHWVLTLCRGLLSIPFRKAENRIGPPLFLSRLNSAVFLFPIYPFIRSGPRSTPRFGLPGRLVLT